MKKLLILLLAVFGCSGGLKNVRDLVNAMQNPALLDEAEQSQVLQIAMDAWNTWHDIQIARIESMKEGAAKDDAVATHEKVYIAYYDLLGDALVGMERLQNRGEKEVWRKARDALLAKLRDIKALGEFL